LICKGAGNRGVIPFSKSFGKADSLEILLEVYFATMAAPIRDLLIYTFQIQIDLCTKETQQDDALVVFKCNKYQSQRPFQRFYLDIFSPHPPSKQGHIGL